MAYVILNFCQFLIVYTQASPVSLTLVFLLLADLNKPAIWQHYPCTLRHQLKATHLS